jgi:hypothetical protein
MSELLSKGSRGQAGCLIQLQIPWVSGERATLPRQTRPGWQDSELLKGTDLH